MPKTTTNQIPDGWSETTLAELMTFSNGRTSPSRLYSGVYPVYGANGILGYSDTTNSDEDTVIIGRVGAYCGSQYYSTKKCWVTDNAIRARVRNNADSHYMFYLLRTLHLNSRAGGSGQPLLNQSILNAIEIVVPDKSEQKAIAAVLSSLDDKIELLRKQNETLEAIAQAIFKEWFVNFNFPDKNGKPYKDSGGRMTDSELGKIPEGWRVVTLDDIADVSIGRTPPRKESEWFSTNQSDIKWISIKDLGKSGVYINNTSEYLTDEAVQRFNVPIIPKNTVVVSFKLTVGRVAITKCEMLSNEAIAHIKLTSGCSLSVPHIYSFLKQFDYSTLGSTSSIATAVNSKSIKTIRVTVPSDYVLKPFSKSIDPLFEKIANNTNQIDTLTQLRDTLLPKLMSGQVRVKRT